MKAIEKLKAQLEVIGATLDVDDYTLHCDAPSGYKWAANGCRVVCIHYASNSQTWLVKAIAEEMDSLRMGLVKITDQKEIEEHRWDTGDDTWGAPADAPDKIEWNMPAVRR